MLRTNLIEDVAYDILRRRNDNLLKIGVDGLDGAGKTTFANELAEALSVAGVNVIRSSTDFFHNPKEVRYALGRSSPEGFFYDSFNYGKMKELLLEPLSNGNLVASIYIKYFNHLLDQVELDGPITVKENCVLVFDGIFLHRAELIDYWDYSIFLNVSRTESLKRCFIRDGNGSPDPLHSSNRRYVEGQKIYLSKCKPKETATIVVNNEVLEEPFVEG